MIMEYKPYHIYINQGDKMKLIVIRKDHGCKRQDGEF
jgi:ribosomal protein L14